MAPFAFAGQSAGEGMKSTKWRWATMLVRAGGLSRYKVTFGNRRVICQVHWQRDAAQRLK